MRSIPDLRLNQVCSRKKYLSLKGSADRCYGLVTKIIPGLNDDEATLQSSAAWLIGDLSKSTSWHLTRFHPAYHLHDFPATPVKRLEAAYQLARAAGVRIPGRKGPAANRFGFAT